MPESSGVVSGVGSEGNKRSLEDEGSSSKEGSSSSATPSSKRAKQDLQSLPTRQYLDQTVVPILLQVPEILFNWDTSNQSQSFPIFLLFKKAKTTVFNCATRNWNHCEKLGKMPWELFLCSQGWEKEYKIQQIKLLRREKQSEYYIYNLFSLQVISNYIYT